MKLSKSCVGIAGLAIGLAAGIAGTPQAFGDERQVGPLGLPRPPFIEVAKQPRKMRSKSMTSPRMAKPAGEALSMRARVYRMRSICFEVDDSQHVDLYDGSLGPSRLFIARNQSQVGRIVWLPEFPADIQPPPQDHPGRVNGTPVCSGTLIAKNLFLTASHCFAAAIREKEGWRTPRRIVNGVAESKVIEAPEIVKLMAVNFNYQYDGTSCTRDTLSDCKLATVDSYPITRLVEYGWSRPEKLDYAIVELGPDKTGKLPGDSYSIAQLDASAKALSDAKELTIIQHPNGDPKKLEAGPIVAAQSATSWDIKYEDLDTRGGASGSGIISQSGKVIGIHTNGGCSSVGYNLGVNLHSIAKVSEIIN